MTQHPLTARQTEFLSHIHGCLARDGWAPSVREMMLALNVRSTNGVLDHLAALERKGVIARDARKSRAIRVTDEGLRQLSLRPSVRWETHGGSHQCAVGDDRIEYEGAPAGGFRWRVNQGPWMSLGADVGREDLPVALTQLRRLGVDL